MNSAEGVAGIAVLLFDDRDPPAPLSDLATRRIDDPADVDVAAEQFERLIVVGGDAQLAVVLTRLVRTDRLEVEVGYVPRWRTNATRIYGLSSGQRAARRARLGSARRVPLVRDETGAVIVGAALWLPGTGQAKLCGEAIVDDTALFDGEVAGVRIEPTAAMPGLRAAALTGWGRPRRWVVGRAAQLGSTGTMVVRDAVRAARPARRSAFYRNVTGWLLVG